MGDLIKLASLELQATLLADMWEKELLKEATFQRPSELPVKDKKPEELPTKPPPPEEPQEGKMRPLPA